MLDRLEVQQEKMERHVEKGSPQSVKELVATFYFSDALKFLGAARLMVRSLSLIEAISSRF